MLEIAIFLGVAIAGALAYGLRRQASNPEPDLVRACRGDAGQASRLIDLEMRRQPTLTRRQAAWRALETLRDENR